MKFNKWISIVLLICSCMLVLVLFQPIWRIELSAPQYPEGLEMNISANGLGGDVVIINGLNHYIGMKTLNNEDFIEFKILPYLISLFAFFFFLVAILRNRKMMYALFISYLLFGALAMIDFWKWEYDYGHHLDPNAAIIVPGMSYQPPLIGFKQLLNFGAYSVPDIGGWLFIAAGLLLLGCIILDYRLSQKGAPRSVVSYVLLGITLVSLSACKAGPEPIRVGKDNCHYCKMNVSDNKFGAEAITQKGKIFKYDELNCLLSDISSAGISKTDIKEIYATDFCAQHQLVNIQNAFFLQSQGVKGPMGGNIAVFSSRDSLNLYLKQIGGEEISLHKIISLK